jgi:IS5 family transposase
MSQPTFAALAFANKKKKTRREMFLAEMEQVVPWSKLLRAVERHYPKPGKGRPPMELEKMLRIYFLQQWYNLSDPAMEDALYDSESLRRFVGLELGQDEVPDETTILHFRHLLERQGLTKKLFEKINEHLQQQGLLMRQGTIVDATIMAAPTSTKNASGKRDPEMSSVKKGNEWHFGMKLHIGVDSESGLAHTATVSTAKLHDCHLMEELLHGEETAVYGDRGYAGRERRERFEASGIDWRVNRRGHRHQPLTKRDRQWNRRQNRVRAQVEHVFHVIKHLWGHRKVRYRGLVNNEAQYFTLLGLANLYLKRRRLLPHGA